MIVSQIQAHLAIIADFRSKMKDVHTDDGKRDRRFTCSVPSCVQGNPGTDGIPGAKGSAVSRTFSLNHSDTYICPMTQRFFTVKFSSYFEC